MYDKPLSVKWANAGDHYGVREDRFRKPVNCRGRDGHFRRNRSISPPGSKTTPPPSLPANHLPVPFAMIDPDRKANSAREMRNFAVPRSGECRLYRSPFSGSAAKTDDPLRLTDGLGG